MLAATLIWGASFFILKNTLDSASVFFLLAFRFIAASVLMSAVFFKCFKSFDKKHLLHGFISGLFLFAAYVTQTYGLVYTTPGKNAFLTAVYCVMVPFMMWIITKKRPTIRTFLAAAVCLCGIGLISLDGMSFNVGDALTLVCALCFALQIVYNSRKLQDKNVILFVIVQFATVGILSLICWAAFDRTVPAVFNGDLIWGLVFITVCATGFGFWAQNFGEKYVAAESSAIILSLESVFGVLFSVLIYGEKPSVQSYIGFVLVFIAVIVSEVSPKTLFDRLTRFKFKPSAAAEQADNGNEDNVSQISANASKVNDTADASKVADTADISEVEVSDGQCTADNPNSSEQSEPCGVFAAVDAEEIQEDSDHTAPNSDTPTDEELASEAPKANEEDKL